MDNCSNCIKLQNKIKELESDLICIDEQVLPFIQCELLQLIKERDLYKKRLKQSLRHNIEEVLELKRRILREQERGQ